MESAVARLSVLPQGAAGADPRRDHSDRRGALNGRSAGYGRIPDYGQAEVLPAFKPQSQQADRYQGNAAEGRRRTLCLRHGAVQSMVRRGYCVPDLGF